MIVVDADAMIDFLVPDRKGGPHARRILSETAATAPQHLDLEVCSGVRKLLLRGQISLEVAEAALDRFLRVKVRRVSPTPLLARCWQLRDTVTPYDASYVALAESLGVPLMTTDARLSRAPGPRCEFVVI